MKKRVLKHRLIIDSTVWSRIKKLMPKKQEMKIIFGELIPMQVA